MAFFFAWVVCQREFAVATGTPFGEIWVFGRKELQGFAGIVAEHLLFDGGGAVVAPLHGEFGVRERVVVLDDLHGGAAAVPSVGWVVLVPEGVAGWQCGVMEQCSSSKPPNNSASCSTPAAQH